MKRYISWFMIVAMLLVSATAFAEVRTLDTEAARAAANEKDVIELSFWYSLGGDGSDAVQKLVENFNASQDKYRMTAEYAGSYGDSLLKFVNSPASERPDVIHINEVGTSKIMDTGGYFPVQQFIDEGILITDGYVESILNAYRYNNEMYAWPFSITVPCIVYNADALAEAGCEPSDMATYEGFKEVCKKITESGAAATGAGIVNDSWILEQMVAMMGSDLVDQGNGRNGRATRLVADQDGSLLKVLETIQDFNTSEWSYQNTEGSSAAIIRQAVASRETAMIIGTAGYFAVTKTLADGAFNMGAYPLFSIAENSGNCYPSGAALWVVDKEDDGARALGVVEFIKFFMREDQQIEFSQISGYLPISETVMQNEDYMTFLNETYPGLDLVIEHVMASTFPGGALFGSLNDMRSIVSTEFTRLSTKESTPEESLESIVSQTNELIELYNLSNF